MKGYDNFLLPVDDMAQARAFYQGLLGMEVKFDFSALGMLAYKVGQEEPAIILQEKSKFPQAKPSIWLVVEDVMAEYDRLHSKGLVFLSPPFEIKTGLAVEFEDPFGNRFALTDYSKAQ